MIWLPYYLAEYVAVGGSSGVTSGVGIGGAVIVHSSLRIDVMANPENIDLPSGPTRRFFGMWRYIVDWIHIFIRLQLVSDTLDGARLYGE